MEEEALEAAPKPGFSARREAGIAARSPGHFSNFHFAILAIVAVAALSVVTASLRMTDRAIERAVAQREAAARFFESELSALRVLALTSQSAVPGRLYLGLESCFKTHVPIPFEGEDSDIGRQILEMCAEMELGRLHAQGGPGMASEGSAMLRQLRLLK